MNKNLLLLVTIIILSQSVYPQQRRTFISWDAFVSVGYGNTGTAGARDYFNYIVENYRSHGIQAQTKTEFGKTAIANAGINFGIYENLGVGLLCGYFYCPAYANYGDYGGALKIDGLVNAFDISVKVRYSPFMIGDFPIILSAQIGACYSSLKITEELKYYNYSSNNYNWEMTSDGWSPIYQVTIGSSITLGKLILGLEGGYTYSWNEVMPERHTSKYGIVTDSRMIEIAPNGLIFLATIGIKL
jgi:hypothetical protein